MRVKPILLERGQALRLHWPLGPVHSSVRARLHEPLELAKDWSRSIDDPAQPLKRPVAEPLTLAISQALCQYSSSAQHLRDVPHARTESRIYNGGGSAAADLACRMLSFGKLPRVTQRRSIGWDVLLNSSGTILPLILSFVIVPLYIGKIGTDRYGVMSLTWILLGYFGFLDFGLSRASANALSRVPNAGPDVRVPILVTSLYLNLALGAVGGIFTYGAVWWWAEHTASLPVNLRAEVSSAIPWIAGMLPLSMVAGVGIGTLDSREKFLLSNVLAVTSGLLGQVLPIGCAILFGPSLSIIIPAAFLARAFSTAVMFASIVWIERPLDLRRFDWTQVRPLFGYGAWVSVSGLISPMLDTFDQMLIGTLLGPSALAHYTVPMTMATRSQFVAGALGKTLFPRLSRLGGEEAGALTMKASVTLGLRFRRGLRPGCRRRRAVPYALARRRLRQARHACCRHRTARRVDERHRAPSLHPASRAGPPRPTRQAPRDRDHSIPRDSMAADHLVRSCRCRGGLDVARLHRPDIAARRRAPATTLDPSYPRPRGVDGDRLCRGGGRTSPAAIGLKYRFRHLHRHCRERRRLGRDSPAGDIRGGSWPASPDRPPGRRRNLARRMTSNAPVGSFRR